MFISGEIMARKKARKNIPLKVQKTLWARSGNRCALCKVELSEITACNSPCLIGEIAHIEGYNKGSARYNPNMTDDERNSYDNLILLCANCHTKIDKDEITYTVQKLKRIKKEHEEWVNTQLKMSMTEFSFAELEVIVKYLVNNHPPFHEEVIMAIPPQEKIQKNNLSNEVAKYINMGMINTHQVKEYLNRHPDPEFSKRLKNEFVTKYIELRNKNLHGDDLFYEQWDFASGNYSEFKYRAAGLTLLTYFFELCEVFER
jgi:5-methylcytosine-specific restriction endonuclease McrA